MAKNIRDAKVPEYLASKLRLNRERWSKLGEKTRALQERLNVIEQRLWNKNCPAF